jgi:ELWxxDGT repeat protein
LSRRRVEGIHTLTNAGGRLFFLRDDRAQSSEFGPVSAQLWTSNGTAVGTRLVKNFVPGHLDFVDNLIAARGQAFFAADGDLWKSNGSVAGTQRLGAAASSTHAFTNVEGAVFFVGEGGIWKSDGTIAGTHHVGDAEPYSNPFCNPHGPCGFVHRNYDPVGVGEQLFFPADGGGLGVELWQTDGSEDGVGVWGDLRPGPEGSKPADLTRVGGSLYFTANDGTHGRELWRLVP